MKKNWKIRLLIGLCFCLSGCISQEQKAYKDAVKLLKAGKYQEAGSAFSALDGYKDSADMSRRSDYLYANSLLESGDYDTAIKIFSRLDDYEDSAALLLECHYQKGLAQLEKGWFDEAISAFQKCSGYKDSDDLIVKTKMDYIHKHMSANDIKTRKYIDELVETQNEDALKLFARMKEISIYSPGGLSINGKPVKGLVFVVNSYYKQTIPVLKYTLTFKSGYQLYGEVSDVLAGDQEQFTIPNPKEGGIEWIFMPPSSSIVFYDEEGNILGKAECGDWTN